MVQTAKCRGITCGSRPVRALFNRVFHRNCEYIDKALRERALIGNHEGHEEFEGHEENNLFVFFDFFVGFVVPVQRSS